MKKLTIPFIFAVVLMSLSGCMSPKDIAYFQNAEDVDLEATRYQHNSKVMPKDHLTVLVSATDASAVSYFNKHIATSGNNSSIGGNSVNYVVDDDGTINFPVVGRIKVAGLTRLQCENLIAEKIRPYMQNEKDYMVTVRFSSFHVTVLGEVGSPGMKTTSLEKYSIVDAIAASGDLTIYGKRDNIMLIREDADGKKSVHRLNINDPEVLKSPYYYLQQNDVIYVEPNSVKKTSATIKTTTSLWFSLASILVSSATLVVNIINK